MSERADGSIQHEEKKHERGVGVVFILLCVALGLIGCKPKPPAPNPPPPAVTVAYPLQREVVEWDVYTGHLEAPESVNLAARVSGMVVETPFTEGAMVKKGQVLVRIDDRPFKADLDTKLAAQETAQAQLDISRLNFGREEQAIKSHAVSQQDYDNARALRDQAEAVLAGAKAAVDASRLNVEWCQVTSPIDGRISNKRVTVGNLVTLGGPPGTLLTTIESVDPMYCYVDVDERAVLKYQKLAVEKKRVSAREGVVPCFVRLGNETTYPHEGVVDFVDNRVDPTTGTIRARGVLPNADGRLTPGFFASMRIPGSGRYQAVLVPDTAIGNDQDGRTVLVVNKANQVEVRRVERGSLFGTLRAIKSGLKPDEWIIINGQMQARPGTKVAPTEEALKIDPSEFADPGSTEPAREPGGPAGPGEAPAKAAPADAPVRMPAEGPPLQPAPGTKP